MLIVGITFAFGIGGNPGFNIHDFFAGLSTEFIGWMLGVTVFQFYYDAKLSARRGEQKNAAPCIADELLKCKNLLDSGAITEEEYGVLKGKLLAKE
jgi:hypothetical protein